MIRNGVIYFAGWNTVTTSGKSDTSRPATSTNSTIPTGAMSTIPAIVWSPASSESKNSSNTPDVTSFTATFQQPDGLISTKTVNASTQTVSSATHTPPTMSSSKSSSHTLHPTVSYPQYTTTNARPTSHQSTLVPSGGRVNITFSSPEPSEIPTVEPSETPSVEPTSPPKAEDSEEAAGEEEGGPSAKPEEGNPEGEPEVDLGAFEEPGPDWVVAKKEWKEAWEFHVYFFGVCFILLGLYSSACVLRLWGMEHLLSRNYFLILHILVITVCIFRATYLLVDAYNSNGNYPVVVDYFLYNTVFPCISSMFSILFYALLLATRVRILSRKIQKLGILSAIVLFHFAISIITDLVVGLLSTAHVLMFICQAFFILWGLLMFIAYLIVFRKLYKGALNRQKTLSISSPDRKHNHNNGSQNKETKHRYTFGLAVKVTFISAFFGVAIVGFEMYGMFGVFGILQPDVKPQPWPWWTYHVIVRALEVLMCASVCYVASQPLRYTPRKDSRMLYQYLLPCNACCCKNVLDSSYDSSTISMENVSETDHLSWLKKKNKKANAPYPPHAAEKYNDPDATLLVRKIRQSRPSMLVVEDGFVRIRRDDEMLPSNQYELDSNSRSSHSSGLNAVVSGTEDRKVPNAAVNYNYGSDEARVRANENKQLNFSFDNYRLPSVGDNRESMVMTEYDTDIDIVVTDSEHSDTENGAREQSGIPPSSTSSRSGDIFRPLSMIDLAASMESELERAFHSNCANKDELNSNRGYKYGNTTHTTAINDVTSDNCGDSDSDQSKTSNARLLRSPIRRCKSEEKPVVTKSKLFAKNRYYSLSNVETVGKDDSHFEDERNVYAHRKRTF